MMDYVDAQNNSNEVIYDRLSEFGTVKLNESLSRYTTFRTGGVADILIYPKNIESVQKIRQLALDNSIPVTVIGHGSNLLISDRGIRGLVLRVSSDGVVPGEIRDEGDGLIFADAMVMKDDFISFAVERGYGGVEFLAGLPGCMGGGIVMNAGTNLGWFSSILDEILLLDGEGEAGGIKISGDMMSYRHLDLKDGWIVLGGYYRLPRSESPEVVKRSIDEILAEREAKHPLEFPSAGSVFKNPEGHSSWRLIDESGLKGKTIGGAAVSVKHTNFIVNTGGATSEDIRSLISCIQEKVFKYSGLRLETEIRMLGEF